MKKGSFSFDVDFQHVWHVATGNKHVAKRDRHHWHGKICQVSLWHLNGTMLTRAQEVKDFVVCFGSLLTDCPRSQKTVIRCLDRDNTRPLITDHVCSYIFNSSGSTNAVQSGDTCCASDANVKHFLKDPLVWCQRRGRDKQGKVQERNRERRISLSVPFSICDEIETLSGLSHVQASENSSSESAESRLSHPQKPDTKQRRRRRRVFPRKTTECGLSTAPAKQHWSECQLLTRSSCSWV